MPKSRFSHLGMVPPLLPEGQEETQAVAVQPVEEAGVVQLNLKVSETLRQALRMKALRLGIPLTEALRPLLQAWVDERY